MRVVGLDIGGANLKGADSEGHAFSRPFAVWKAPERLGAEIGRLLAGLPKADVLAVTMTAELADCYATKAEGVDAILAAVEQAAGNTPIRVWQTAGRFVAPVEARAAPLLVAAANWHALATFVGRLSADSSSLLVDIGTTTTDLIPIREGVPVPAGRTDSERLQCGELVYTGVCRTPVCAVVPSVPFRGAECPLAAELFATTRDVYLALGQLPEEASDTDTANGRPATIVCARDRLARSLCCDATEFTADDAVTMSRTIAAAQRRQIARAIGSVAARQDGPPREIFVSGAGAFVAEQTLREWPDLAAARQVRIADLFTPEVAAAACAYAVARLAADPADRRDTRSRDTSSRDTRSRVE